VGGGWGLGALRNRKVTVLKKKGWAGNKENSNEVSKRSEEPKGGMLPYRARKSQPGSRHSRCKRRRFIEGKGGSQKRVRPRLGAGGRTKKSRPNQLDQRSGVLDCKKGCSKDVGKRKGKDKQTGGSS